MRLTPEQQDALQELLTIGVGRAAATLSRMVDARILLEVPTLVVYRPEDEDAAEALRRESSVLVELGFEGNFDGGAVLALPRHSAMSIADLFVDSDRRAEDLDTLRVGALTEIGNIVLNYVMGTVMNILKDQVLYLPPRFGEGVTDLRQVFDGRARQHSVLLVADAFFRVDGHEIHGDILILCGERSFERLRRGVDRLLTSATSGN